jgi:tetratricopeptide (TPR) repeat protein
MTVAVSPLAWRLDDRLREVPLDPEAFAREVDARVEAIATMKSQPAKLLAMLIAAAPLLRIAGRLEESRKTASAAIAIAELVGDDDSAFAGHVALAQVLQREGQFAIATPLYDRLAAQARSMPARAERLHDVLYEVGRNLFDQGLLAQAAKCFRESQLLRRTGRREELLEACAEAIRRTTGRNA